MVDQINDIQAFIAELSGFAATAESTLAQIESDLDGNKGLFSVFYEKMFAIRGTAEQLALPNIASIASLGEEIAHRATEAQTRAQLRKCVSSLWDALTTTKYLLEHIDEETNEEQAILVHHLKDTLRRLGGPSMKTSQIEIDELIKKANG